MIKNYFLITVRNFLRNRNYTLINMLGLSIGITSCIIIFLMITNDLSFDKFHSRYGSIYRIVVESKSASGLEYNSTTPYPTAKAFRQDFSDVPLATQIHSQEEVLVKIGTEKIEVDRAIFADSLFFEVFDFKVLSGNPKSELGQPGKVFLTKSLADKILKGKDTGTIKLNNKIDLDVVGIVADPPANSHISFSMIVSMPSLTPEFVGFPLDRWGMHISGYTYFVLPQEIRPSTINERLASFRTKYLSEEEGERKNFVIQSLADIHTDRNYIENPGSAANADTSDLIVMGVLGLFILAIACVNFINLATALAVKKSKEIGIRKTLGAGRAQLSAYFLGETFLLTVFSVVISLCIVEWTLRWLNNFLEVQLELNLLTNPFILVFLVVLILFTTILAGFYPAIILSGFNPLAVLKNKISAQGTSGAMVRKILVVFQFIIAQVLIMGTLIISDQMNYFKQKPLGFDKDAIIGVPLPENDPALLESFKGRLANEPGIESMTFSVGAPTSESNFTTGFYLSEKGAGEHYRVAIKPVDRHYLETYGISLKAGRWFTEADEKEAAADVVPEDRKYVFVVNESAARRLGFSNPEEILGKKITTGFYDISREVVGVVEDFHTSSLHDRIAPVVIMIIPQYFYEAGIKVKPGNIKATIASVEKTWTGLFPEYNFEYQFLDESLAKLYKHDDRTFTLFKIFSGISIFIGCLGLYGLISFMASQKLKEVGIRKVLGASAGSIMVLFSKEFVKLILLAFVIAAPLAWYFMDQWLQGFAYRISIAWTVYIIGITSTLIIAILTVSYRSAQAAVSNPAETLRTE